MCSWHFDNRQLGVAGPAAYVPARVGVQCLLRGGDTPDERALNPCPRPIMLVTPAASAQKAANATGIVFVCISLRVAIVLVAMVALAFDVRLDDGCGFGGL